MSIIKAISLADAITELQPPQHWRLDKAGKPSISYNAAMRSWFTLPSGRRIQVRASFGGQFRRFVQSCYTKKEVGNLLANEIDGLLDGNVDNFCKWYILDSLIEAGIHLSLFATETAATERIA